MSSTGSSTSPSAASSGSRLSRRLPAAQLLPNRGVTSPPSLPRPRVRVQDAVADGAHPLPLTPEYQRRLHACAPIAAAVVLDAAALRPKNGGHARRRASAATPAPTLPPREAQAGRRSPPPVPPRRKSTRLTTTAVCTRRQQQDRAEQQHEYENLDELLRQEAAAEAAAAAPAVRPPPSPVRTYCRAPCRLKMMSLLDSNVKHTCVLPTGSHMPRPLAALSGARYGPQQPCVAPCPLKLTSMLHGGAKHVCVPQNEDPLRTPTAPVAPAAPASFAAADESPRGCCRADRFPHLADDCAGDEDEDVDVTGVDTTCSTVGSASPVSVASIASADDARCTPRAAAGPGPPRMTRSSSSGALRAAAARAADGRVGRPGRRRSVSTKRTPSNASTKSDFVVVKQRRRSLRWPAATAGSAPQSTSPSSPLPRLEGPGLALVLAGPRGTPTPRGTRCRRCAGGTFSSCRESALFAFTAAQVKSPRGAV
ncbi:hypothetical protein ONE63_008487 [Megalurothrips usitatus]|uniref:Uncharacterized protein n=1 Tax=Megalurothrips usitatus TaxID=439358 RepID=A0AAV7XNU4_9NEOP|nr:hypothetical protein ONE63_008487 [Megalurothrips usitatus]